MRNYEYENEFPETSIELGTLTNENLINLHKIKSPLKQKERNEKNREMDERRIERE